MTYEMKGETGRSPASPASPAGSDPADGTGPPPVGVLALQGNFAAHARALEAAGSGPVREVRTPEELVGLRGLILPGGESTALLRLMAPLHFDEALRRFHQEGGVLFGTCAGLILLATRVTHPEQPSLGLIDVTVERNAYGRQIASFVATGEFTLPGEEAAPAEMVFIRAPRIVETGPGVTVLARLDGEVVMVEQGSVMAGSFHPEMSAPRPGGSLAHRYFLRRAVYRDHEERMEVTPRGNPGTVHPCSGETG